LLNENHNFVYSENDNTTDNHNNIEITKILKIVENVVIIMFIQGASKTFIIIRFLSNLKQSKAKQSKDV